MNQNIKEIREKYLPGIKVRLVKMEDDQAPPIGTEGVVHSVDAIGSVKVLWNTGSTLSVIIGEDEIEIINENESSERTVYNAYSEGADITFILEDKNNSTSVVGFYYGAYSARTAHPFRRNGAPFRFKLSKAQLVD